MPFVRVRGAGKNDPPHEFDVRVEQYNRYPDRYELIDGEPVKTSRPATFGTPAEPKPAPAPKPPRRKPATKTTRPKPVTKRIAAEAAETKENQ